ncbi:methyl-accepting chemotaxis protein [Rahnella sp. SAP-1]|uniref:Methyl-accepting chemotaxis protein n=1 Tax=Rouxiella aceris TaxID=2703884 RepID=A0A848MFK4_9GAMM|nr:methyl-accepting chemotaxis protein [Rouxiella aceris]NMP25951.1 methyl-accepting chemotaxis protein [Rouxiella aceris]
MKVLKNISFRKMIMIILTIFSLIWGMTTYLTFNNFNTIDGLLNQTLLQKGSYRLLVRGNDQYFRATTRMLRAMDYRQTADNAEADKTFASADAAVKISQDMLAQFRVSQHPGVSDEVIQAMVGDWDALLNKAIVPMLAAAKNNQPDQFRDLFRKTYPQLSVQFGATAEKYSQAIQSNILVEQSQAQVAYNKYILLSALFAGIITLLLTDRYLVNFLDKPVSMIKRHLETLTAGKLDIELSDFGRNSVGQLIPYIRAMQKHLRDTVEAISQSSDSIYTSTNQIKQGNEELSGRTDQQAAALQQTAASMEELTSTVKNNAENVRQARRLTETTQLTAKKGGDTTSTVVNTMHTISENSKKISDITSVINSIAFQTNILALNAAVESARAGEHGRGFAVVASEVRALAQRSASAAKEIEGLINESVVRVKAGVEQVQDAGNAMSMIIQSVEQVNHLMGEISVASEEQSRGIEQIGLAMTEMDGVTHQNATLVQQAATNAADLEQEAEQLRNTIATFELGNLKDAQLVAKVRNLGRMPQLSIGTSSGSDNWEKF